MYTISHITTSLCLLSFLSTIWYASATYSTTNTTKTVELNVVTWKQKPFLFDAEDNQTYGILVEAFQMMEKECSSPSINYTVKYSIHFKSEENITKVLLSDVEYGQGALADVSESSKVVLWGPFTRYIRNQLTDGAAKRNLIIKTMFSSKTYAVILPKHKVLLLYKIWLGIMQCSLTLFVSIIFAIIFGIIIWLVERRQNPRFQQRFTSGTFIGIYWSVVTMTTVGYGDIVPVTVLGRTVTFVWTIIGIMFISVITATLTNAVTGIAGLEIQYQRVAVIRNSIAHIVVTYDYHCDALAYDSYDEVFDAVREGRAFAAVVMSDIAAHYTDEIRADNPRGLNQADNYREPLRVVYTLPGEIPINFMWDNRSKDAEDLYDCIFNRYKSEIIEWPEKLYKRNLIIETVLYADIVVVFKNNTSLLVIFCLLIFVILCGVIFDLIFYIRRSSRKKSRAPIANIDSKKLYETMSILSMQLQNLSQNQESIKIQNQKQIP